MFLRILSCLPLGTPLTPGTWEAKAGRFCEFEDGEGYKVRPCLTKKMKLNDVICQGGRMAQWVKAIAVQSSIPEFKPQDPCERSTKHLSDHRDMPIHILHSKYIFF